MMRRYAWSYLIGLGLTLVVGVGAGVLDSERLGVLLAPGMLLAALVVPEGAHAGPVRGLAWFILAGLIDALLLSCPVAVLWTLVLHRNRGSKSTV